MTPPATGNAGRRLAPRILIALAAALGALGLCEIGARTWLATRGTPWSAADARERVRRMELEVGGAIGWDMEADAPEGRAYESLELHPYFGYDAANVGRTLEGVVARLREPRDDEISVVLVGGSVAALFRHPTDGGAVELERRVTADPRARGRSVELWGYSRPGYKEPQQLHVVADLLRQGARPDVVLNLDGYNELALSLQNLTAGLPADWPSGGHWLRVSAPPPDARRFDLRIDAEVARRAFAEEAREVRASPLLASAILGSRAFGRLAALESRTRRALDAHAAARTEGQRSIQVDLEEALPLAVDVWERSSAVLARLCAAHGVAYVHALQPTLQDRGSKPLSAEERRDGLRGGFSEVLVQGYPLLRAAGARLAAEGVAFHDASDVFQDVAETLYYDPCHFNGAGNRILAARLAEALLAALE